MRFRKNLKNSTFKARNKFSLKKNQLYMVDEKILNLLCVKAMDGIWKILDRHGQLFKYPLFYLLRFPTVYAKFPCWKVWILRGMGEKIRCCQPWSGLAWAAIYKQAKFLWHLYAVVPASCQHLLLLHCNRPTLAPTQQPLKHTLPQRTFRIFKI